MTDPRIEEIRKRLAEATPEPWESCIMSDPQTGKPITPKRFVEYIGKTLENSFRESGSNDFYFVHVQKPDGPADVCHVGNGPTSRANSRLIAHAPSDLQYLLAQSDTLARMREALAGIEGFLQRAKEKIPDFRTQRITSIQQAEEINITVGEFIDAAMNSLKGVEREKETA